MAALKRVVVVVAVLGVCVAVSGCGSNKVSQKEAKQNLCTSLDNFTASIANLQGLSLTSSSAEDLRRAASRVDDAWGQVVADAKDVKNASTDKLQSAYQNLKKAIQNRPTDKPVSQVIAGLQPKLTAFSQAWTQLVNGLGCHKS
jgi:hypothetical protein